MRNLKIIFIVLISSLVLQSTAFAKSSKVTPNYKLTKEITWMLDSADYLNLKGESVEITIVLRINDEEKLVIVDTGTEIQILDEFIRNKLNKKKIRTRKIKKNLNYFMTVRFEPRKN